MLSHLGEYCCNLESGSFLKFNTESWWMKISDSSQYLNIFQPCPLAYLTMTILLYGSFINYVITHHLFSFRMCEATLCINVRISRLTKKYKERRKKKSRGSWDWPDGCYNSPTAFVANQKSFQWIVGKVKCSDSIYLFWKDIWWGSVWSEKEKTWPKKFQFLKHNIQGGMLIQGTCAAVTRESVICPLSNF